MEKTNGGAHLASIDRRRTVILKWRKNWNPNGANNKKEHIENEIEALQIRGRGNAIHSPVAEYNIKTKILRYAMYDVRGFRM